MVTNIYICLTIKELIGDIMAWEIWILTILKIISVIIGGHLAITKLLPALKKILVLFIKEDGFVTSIISTILIYVGVLVLKFIVTVLVATENKYLIYTDILSPGLEVMLSVIPYVLYFMIAVVIVAGIKK